MTFEDYLAPEEDNRPIIGHCEQCGGEIHGETDGYYADEYGKIDGILLHRECVMDYFDQHCMIGG